jgi:hypothetical protein
MKPVNQKYIHIEGKQNGDCWRACIASILNLEINYFPEWNINESFDEYYPKVFAILKELGWQWGEIKINNTGSDSLVKYAVDGYVIAIGKSPRSTDDNRVNHAVVWKNGIVHDPHPDNTGILDIISFEVLMKINNDENIQGKSVNEPIQDAGYFSDN